MIPAKEIDGELWVRAADIRVKELQQQLKMDLRDYFAAKAMTGLMGFGGLENIATSAYAMADAMLKEREK